MACRRGCKSAVAVLRFGPSRWNGRRELERGMMGTSTGGSRMHPIRAGKKRRTKNRKILKEHQEHRHAQPSLE